MKNLENLFNIKKQNNKGHNNEKNTFHNFTEKYTKLRINLTPISHTSSFPF